MPASSEDSVRQLTPDLEKGSVAHSEPECHKIHTSNNGSYVHMGPYTFRRDELRDAFGGTLNPGIAPPPPVRGYNSVPMGLGGFSICAFVVSLVHLQTRSVTNQSIVIGGAFFVGGAILLISGLLALVVDNTFAGTALSLYGGFWLSYGAILCQTFGIVTSYTSVAEYQNALGLYLLAWCIFSFIMWTCTFKATWPFFSLFLLLTLWIGILSGASFTGSVATLKAGGVFGLLSTFNGFYLMWAGVATHENSYIVAHPLHMPFAPKLE